MVLNEKRGEFRKETLKLRMMEVGFQNGDALYFRDVEIMVNNDDFLIIRVKNSSPLSIYEFKKDKLSYLRYYDEI